VGAESLIADVSLVCPDPLDLWIPVTEVENQIGSIPIADQSNDPFDMRSSSAWEKRLGQRIHDLTSHIAKYSEVLTAATSERIRVEDQLAELELELELLRGRKVDLEAEGSTLTPVPSVEDVSDGVGVEADAENVEPIEEDQPMKDSTRDPASHETIEPAQGGEVTQVPAVDQIDSENDVNLEEKSAAEASLAQEVNQ
jgi:phage shock protein A